MKNHRRTFGRVAMRFAELVVNLVAVGANQGRTADTMLNGGALPKAASFRVFDVENNGAIRVLDSRQIALPGQCSIDEVPNRPIGGGQRTSKSFGIFGYDGMVPNGT